MLPLTTASPAYAGLQVLATAIRHLMTYVLWAVAVAVTTATSTLPARSQLHPRRHLGVPGMRVQRPGARCPAALVTAAVCWCCGQGARAAWARVGPPARRDDVHREATAGIRELETYLAAQADHA